LAPNEIAADGRSLTTTIALAGGGARSLTISEDRPGRLAIAVAGRPLGAKANASVLATVRLMFALDDDLSPFYAAAKRDPDLAFAARGAGRILRAPTAFEEVVRTVCTTNCAWSGTIRMIEALVTHLGERAPGAPQGGWRGRAFPTPAAVASAEETFFRDVARAGYRGAYLRKLGELAGDGSVDLEALRSASRADLSDEELEERLRELPGVGPYAAAHIMLLFGRRSRLVLDSWTRPEYARLIGKKRVADRTIVRRFKPYREEAGLAFWLFLWKTRHESDVT
jgi:3-methyladenine DNA glycosylase/8-oxoguanine DNA glycosylase